MQQGFTNACCNICMLRDNNFIAFGVSEGLKNYIYALSQVVDQGITFWAELAGARLPVFISWPLPFTSPFFLAEGRGWWW